MADAALTGSSATRLIVLRGTSGSGKSSIARAVRDRHGRGCALIEQDYLRRIVLKERDVLGGIAPLLISQTVRFALDHGYHVILEGILATSRYGAMLGELSRAHRGLTLLYYLDVSLDESLRRHATRPQASQFSEDDMRGWYHPLDLLSTDDEQVIGQDSSFEDSVAIVSCHLTGAPSAAALDDDGHYASGVA